MKKTLEFVRANCTPVAISAIIVIASLCVLRGGNTFAALPVFGVVAYWCHR